MAYIIKYGLGEYFKDTLKEDLHHVPFPVKFDESTTTQTCTLYNVYTFYSSKLPNWISVCWTLYILRSGGPLFQVPEKIEL